MIRFPCDCGEQLQVPEDSAGKKVRCPKCSAVVTAPVLPTVPAQEAEVVEVVETGVEVAPEEAPRRRREEVRADRPEEDERGRIPRRLRDEEDEGGNRFRRPAGSSGKAVASLILGILSFPCLGNVLTGLPGLILGILALGDVRKGRVAGGKGLAVAGIVLSCLGLFLSPLLLLALLLPAVSNVRDAAARMQSGNNLKQMAIAMHGYHDVRREFPSAGMRAGQFVPGLHPADGNDRPLLSWRVALLPSLEQLSLYNQFHHDEPWDSPHNLTLLPQMPKVYAIPGQIDSSPGKTYYQVFVGPGAMFDPRGPVSIQDVADGISNTLLIVEAANSVPWTKPEDLPFEAGKPLPPLGGHFRRAGFHAALADGAVQFLPTNTPETTLRAMITRSGGEVFRLP